MLKIWFAAALTLVAGEGTRFEGAFLPPFTEVHEDDDLDSTDTPFEDIAALKKEGRKCIGLALSDAASLGPYQVGVLKQLTKKEGPDRGAEY